MERSKPRKKPSKRISTEKSPGEGGLSLRARIWFDMDGETFIAPGRATLLERIDRYGSISKAAKSMEMSYRHAWLLVDDMNRKAISPLVERVSGGKGGGGTVLTVEGKKTLERFEKLQGKIRNFVEEVAKENGML
ncbi:MAG: LysR family transcriptional regulator [Deltaproteobacteria bacterium]|nr:LysR family transcriptional regulator [Deltaproteobacteria bacterium]